MNNISELVKSIVQHQELVIGPLALEQANKVTGLSVSDGGDIKVAVTGSDTDKILTELVKKYEQLFGRASIEVCRDAIKEVKPPVPVDQLPQILR